MFGSAWYLVITQIQFSLIKKTKIGRPEHSLTPHSPLSNNISFLPHHPTPPPPPPFLKVDVICVSPLIIKKKEKLKQECFIRYNYYTKPTWKIYVRHRQHGQSLSFHLFIALLKKAIDCKLFIWVGTSSQIFGARWDSVSEPYIIDLIGLEWNVLLFLVLYERLLLEEITSFIISGENPFTILYNLVARICIFLWCNEKELSVSRSSSCDDVLLLYEDTFHAFYWFCYEAFCYVTSTLVDNS